MNTWQTWVIEQSKQNGCQITPSTERISEVRRHLMKSKFIKMFLSIFYFFKPTYFHNWLLVLCKIKYICTLSLADIKFSSWNNYWFNYKTHIFFNEIELNELFFLLLNKHKMLTKYKWLMWPELIGCSTYWNVKQFISKSYDGGTYIPLDCKTYIRI